MQIELCLQKRESFQMTERSKLFKKIIEEFLDKERASKLGKNPKPEDVAKYEYFNWLSNASRVSKSVQLATHPIKATYPDVKIKDATSVFVKSTEMLKHEEVGSHSLNENIYDGTGDAAALVVVRFLYQVKLEGRPLIFWILENDPDLLLAFGENGAELNEAFKKAWRANEPAKSHCGAKQLYWLVDKDPTLDENFHLLQPLFSSSLAHAVHADIQEVRFGEANKQAREARRKKEPHDQPYYNYVGLAARKLGGTKPQNISQLNLERGGVNYLLSSLPPTWRSDQRIRLLKVDSVMGGFLWFEDVRELINQLSSFLHSNPEPTHKTRAKRQKLEQALGRQLALFGDNIRFSQEPGWTRSSDCRLPMHEKLWLDSERTELPVRETHESEDTEFNSAYEFGDWPDQVAGSFANWMNAQLHKAGINFVGDAEYKHWARQAVLDVDWPIPLQRRAVGGEA